MIEVFKKYKEAGFACLPCKRDKAPLLSQTWNQGFESEVFRNAEVIGIICGEISGGLECLDFDNHFGDAKENLGKYLAIPEVNEIYTRYKLPIESTMSGGFHMMYRCKKNDKNKKLATRLKDGRPDAIIETRGEGGYFVAAPSPGYKVIRNDIHVVNEISEFERAILIDNAISMNEFQAVIRTEYESGERPGDLYNSSSDAIHTTISVLKEAGWNEVSPGRWRRPGKKEGISATLGKAAEKCFYVFTSNGWPFEPMKGYSPFQVLALLRFNGDFSKAAESLPKPEKTVIETKSKIGESELEKILKSAMIDTRRQVDRPPTILTIMETDGGTSLIHKRVFTLGNFSCIIGKAKSKKTFFLSMITASMLMGKNYTNKFSGELPHNKNTVLYFDTEQGDYDSYNTIKRIETIAGTSTNLKAFMLRPFSPSERCQIVEYAFKVYGERSGFCVIDGIADLATAVNDEDEATRVASILLRLTKVYNCHIVTVLHQNKNDNFATGWMGSAIMKKAEIIISVTKSPQDNSYSEVNCDMSRGIDFNPFSFRINPDGLPEVTEQLSKPVNQVTYSNERETFQMPF